MINLASDPLETKNLIHDNEYKSVLASLREKTNKLCNKFSDPRSDKPYGLTVEYIRKPESAKIIDPKPEFSWEVPQVAGFQKAYQVLVASSSALLEQNIGNMWNSGQVRSDQSINVEYAGFPLSPNSNYFWKVRIFDCDNRCSEYSDVQQFRTGVFSDQVSSGIQRQFFPDRTRHPRTSQKNRKGRLFH